jgi:hypothetical protein
MNRLNTIVSYFNKFNELKSRDVNLYELLTTPDPKGLEIQMKIRNIDDEQYQKKLKMEAPCFTISGKFKSSHCMSDLIEHTGLIAIDIDRKDNTHFTSDEFAQIKIDLAKSPFVAYIGHSIRGVGYFIIMPISNPERHEQHFLMVEDLFKKLPKPVYIDSQCKNVNRLRYYSYDPNAFFNTNAKPLPCFSNWSKPATTNTQKWSAPVQIGESDFENYLNAINIDITGDYNQWLKIGFAIASEFGEMGEGYFHRISRFSPLYDEQECHIKYLNCCKSKNVSGGVTIATFYHYCKQYGIEVNNNAKVNLNNKSEPSCIVPPSADDLIFQAMVKENPHLLELVDSLNLVNPSTGKPYMSS